MPLNLGLAQRFGFRQVELGRGRSLVGTVAPVFIVIVHFLGSICSEVFYDSVVSLISGLLSSLTLISRCIL